MNSRGARNSSLQFGGLNKISQRSIEGDEPVVEFNDIKTAFALFDFCDERLGFAENIGHVGLGEVAGFT